MRALPYPIARLIDAARVGELTVIGPDGSPITYPMVPLLWGDRIFMTSSVLDSTKIAHIKANPRVSFSVTNPEGLGTFTGKVTVQCDARVAEDDLHAGWERLLRDWTRKDPSTVALLKARLGFPLVFERALIELTPRRTWFWPDGRTDQPPQITVVAEVAR
ncbi:MAG TPA: pyridoxamine 5'-phosphate oxidase family protein [Candidatus Limnocylindrales bacterium]